MRKILVLSLLISSYGMAQRELGYVQQRMHDIQTQKSIGEAQKTFKESSVSKSVPASLQTTVSKATFFEVNSVNTEEISKSSKDVIHLSFPMGDETIDVVLEKTNPLANDFKISTGANPNKTHKYHSKYTHYRGVVVGDDFSIAAISISKDEICGLIGTDQGNFVIGKLTGKSESRHVLYNDRDLLKENPVECKVPEDEVSLPYTPEELAHTQTKSLSNCVRVFVVVDKSVFDDKGSVDATADYIAGIFNQVTTLYVNESINLVVSEMQIWDTEDPYLPGNTTEHYLWTLGLNNLIFNGNLCTLLSYHASGGLATVNSLCQFNPYSYNSIRTNFATVPTYSWTTNVVAHELGHNLGSKHTHDCVWNGNSTQIDDCGNIFWDQDGDNSTQPESCYDANNPIVNGAGSIMSYCHLNPVGMNLNFGFGEQPGNLIRNKVQNASCLSACDNPPTTYCSSNGQNTSDEWIEAVTVGSFSNVSGDNDGYFNFSNTSILLEKGKTVDVSLAPGFANNTFPEYWKIWIDLNQNGVFESNEELFSADNTQTIANGTLTIPSNANIGETRMRVSMKYNSEQTPCESFSFGEVEDYTVSIVNPYCESKGETTEDEWIEHVSMWNISNISGDNNGYKDFSNLISLNTTIGSEIFLTLTPGHSGQTFEEHWVVWIDYNRDGDFEDNGEEVFYDASHSAVSGSFSIPFATLNGSTKMRVAMRYGTKPTPCQTFSYGEVEDYNVNIGSGIAPTFAPMESLETQAIDELTFRTYPNPATNELNVQFDREIVGEVSLGIFSMTGAKVLGVNEKDLNDITKLDLSGIESGSYLLVIRTNNRVLQSKISIVR